MKLSAPIYRLKREAKLKSRSEGIPLHEALDQVARVEGFSSWSLLSSRLAEEKPARSVFRELNPGDLVLLGARPGHGKTLLGMEIMVEAMKAGRKGWLFTLEYSDPEVIGLFVHIGEVAQAYEGLFAYDNSDGIEAGYIIERLAEVEAGAVVVIDYLQILDQNRDHADLSVQVEALKAFAAARGIVIAFIAQIDRRFAPETSGLPGLDDVRLPNPLDLTVFDKTCFLHNGEMQVQAIA